MARRQLAGFLLITLFAFLPAASHGQAGIMLNGTVGPGFTIALRDASGSPLQHLNAGTHTIVVRDLSGDHNFHLFGPGVDQRTGVSFVGTVTWTVTFQQGTYLYQCDPHSPMMKGSFVSASAPVALPPSPPSPPSPPPSPPPSSPPPPPSPPSSPPPSPPPAPFAPMSKLSGAVGPGAKIALTTAAGKRATKVEAGTYRLTVKDLSRSDNFHLSGPDVNRRTGVAFKGTVTWRVRLEAGRHTYRSDRRKRLRGVLIVTPGTATHAGHG